MNMTPSNGFGTLGIAPKLLEILSKNKLVQPTPIQEKSIPVAITGKDIMGIAQTGTGKTLAFGIPMIQLLAQHQGAKKGLVLLPTRELAIQVDASLRKVGQVLGLKTAVLIGGEPMHRQFRALKNNPHIVIATPGRLNDHIENSKLRLDNVAIVVLDEADHMLDMGFAPQIKKIMDRVPKQRQTMLFSATMPDQIISLANHYMHMPLRVEVAPPGTAVKTVTQELYFIDRAQKNSLLKNILNEYKGSVLIFSRTKHKAKDVARMIRNAGFTSAEIHSNRSQSQRREALNGFKLGKYRILVATDIAARGIDVSGIQLVINYDLPATGEDYVHRIGRTGRAGMTGHAISFASHDQKLEIRRIERLIKKTLNVAKIPDNLPRDSQQPSTHQHQSHRSQRNTQFSRNTQQRRHSQERQHIQPRHSNESDGFQPRQNNDESRHQRPFNKEFRPKKKFRGNFKPQKKVNRRDGPRGPSRPGLHGGEGAYFLKRHKQ